VRTGFAEKQEEKESSEKKTLTLEIRESFIRAMDDVADISLMKLIDVAVAGSILAGREPVKRVVLTIDMDVPNGSDYL